jgi:hypothetical protein
MRWNLRRTGSAVVDRDHVDPPFAGVEGSTRCLAPAVLRSPDGVAEERRDNGTRHP